MKIEYKQPYWIKYKWELKDHDSQLVFVTPYNKSDATEVSNFIYNDCFSIMCKFKIENDFTKDVKAGIYGKSGQNFGLNFDYSIDSLVFEFRTIDIKNEIKFHCIIIDEVNSKLINDGVNIIIIKDKNQIIIYCDSKIVSKYEYSGDSLIEDYRDSPFYLGCLNPGAKDKKDRCYSEINVDHFSIIINNNSVEIASSLLISSEFHTLPMKPYYKDIICLYDFELINNYGNIFDNSKYSNFLELIPKQYVI
jgi:hypothetical protein